MTPSRPSQPRPRLVVVGNGAGRHALATVEELLKLAPDLYGITVFGAEPQRQPQPHPAVAGASRQERPSTSIMLNTRDWYAQNGIELLAGDPVVAIEPPKSRRRIVPRLQIRPRGAL
ncbi:hypothetical protein ACTMU2_12695 [Cupriavidus basilensis]